LEMFFHTSAEIQAKMRARRKREEKIGVPGAKRNSIAAQIVMDHAITETEKNKIIQPQLQISKKSATLDISCLKNGPSHPLQTHAPSRRSPAPCNLAVA